MATRNEQHAHDMSTLANFIDWGQAINTALTAFGWVQTADTGQVNWGTIVSVPTTGNSVYEIWKPGDGGTVFYFRIDYLNGGSAPQFKLQCGTTTNGAGTLTGFTTTQVTTLQTANSGATLFNCLFRGDSSSFSIMMWRDLGAAGNTLFSIDRCRNSSGATTNDYFTMFVARAAGTGNPYFQQSIVFGVGAAPALFANNVSTWGVITGGAQFSASNQSMTFNGKTAITPVFPLVGAYDVPTLAVAMGAQADFSELATMTPTMLSASHTFVFSKNQNFAAGSGLGVFMRWE